MTSHAASYEALSDFSFANLAQAHALQVLVPDSCTKITAAFRIFFFTGKGQNGVFHDFSW